MLELENSVGVDIPIIITEWGCWLFPNRTNQDLNKWLDHHVDLFDAHNIGSMWYTEIQNNQRAFGILILKQAGTRPSWTS